MASPASQPNSKHPSPRSTNIGSWNFFELIMNAAYQNDIGIAFVYMINSALKEATFLRNLCDELVVPSTNPILYSESQ